MHGRATLSVRLQVRALRAEKVRWLKASRKAGKSLSEWLRGAANKAAAD